MTGRGLGVYCDRKADLGKGGGVLTVTVLWNNLTSLLISYMRHDTKPTASDRNKLSSPCGVIEFMERSVTRVKHTSRPPLRNRLCVDCRDCSPLDSG